jgi:hypothetical protein
LKKSGSRGRESQSESSFFKHFSVLIPIPAPTPDKQKTVSTIVKPLPVAVTAAFFPLLWFLNKVSFYTGEHSGSLLLKNPPRYTLVVMAVMMVLPIAKW